MELGNIVEDTEAVASAPDAFVKSSPTVPGGPGHAVIGGICTSLVTRAELAEMMRRDVAHHKADQPPRVISASNGAVIAAYHHDPVFRGLIDQCDLVDADGMSLVFASRLFLRKPLKERTATTDFIEDASAVAARNGIRFFFLGARPGVAQTAADLLSRRYPGLQIAGCHHGYFAESEIDSICETIRAARTDILWLGMGSPLQEHMALRLREKLPGITWIRTCGGLFDHCSGRVPRAPAVVQSLGLEWLHRSLLEPIRLGRRYLKSNPIALYLLLTRTYDIPRRRY